MPWRANWSRFGVRPAMMPRWYAPRLNQPTSSPMMKTMLGLLCACAVAAIATEHNAMSVNHNARSKLLLAFMRDLVLLVRRNLFLPAFHEAGWRRALTEGRGITWPSA